MSDGLEERRRIRYGGHSSTMRSGGTGPDPWWGLVNGKQYYGGQTFNEGRQAFRNLVDALPHGDFISNSIVYRGHKIIVRLHSYFGDYYGESDGHVFQNGLAGVLVADFKKWVDGEFYDVDGLHAAAFLLPSDVLIQKSSYNIKIHISSGISQEFVDAIQALDFPDGVESITVERP